MHIDLSTLPAGVYAFGVVVFTSPLITSVVMYFLNRNKVNAEVEGIIGHNYRELLDAYKEERSLLSKEMENLRTQQTVYMENSNEVLRTNRQLQVEVKSLGQEHRNCEKKSKELTESLDLLTQKLRINGIV